MMEIFAVGIVGIIIYAIVALAIYFIPTIIAFRRGHDNRVIILLVNLFLGVTVAVWVICLIWALRD